MILKNFLQVTINYTKISTFSLQSQLEVQISHNDRKKEETDSHRGKKQQTEGQLKYPLVRHLRMNKQNIARKKENVYSGKNTRQIHPKKSTFSTSHIKNDEDRTRMHHKKEVDLSVSR